MRKIYLATSWRNKHYDHTMALLIVAGHEMYDFRDPQYAFKWDQIDLQDAPTSAPLMYAALQHPRAIEGFQRDKAGLDWCNLCILLTPCGNSAHLELGYAVGQGKPGIIYMAEDQGPDLMYKFAQALVSTPTELLEAINLLPENA